MDAERRNRLACELGDEELAGLLVSARRDLVQPLPQPLVARHLRAMVRAAGTAAALGAAAAGAGTVAAVATTAGGRTGTGAPPRS